MLKIVFRFCGVLLQKMEGSSIHKEDHNSFDLLFVGNFVQDIIHTISPEDNSSTLFLYFYLFYLFIRKINKSQ